MSFRARFFSVIVIVCFLMLTPAYAAEEGLASPDIQETTLDNGTERLPDEQNIPKLTGPVILDVSVQGNVEVVTEHIKSIITSKVGEPVDEEKLRKDAEAIFELGFFVATDYRVTDKADGVDVLFLVQENPVVSKINFEGNTVFSDEKLEEMIFTKPGMIFNRTFFRNDIQRIREKYQADGYVMANIADVRIEGTEITVVLVEPKISQIIIQGNKITKTHVVRRYLKIKEGELFNSNKLRLSLSRLQGVGFFSDVNVNFEPDEDPNDVIVVLTVEEGRTGKLGFNIAYGTQSGFGGGLSYENTNMGGKGMKLSAGFDLGDREEYWLSYEQPYMGGKVTAWKIGAYKRAWSDLRYYIDDEEKFKYDRDKIGAFFGFGRKFKEESIYNWYLLFDWHEVKNDPNNPPAGFEKSNWGNIPIDDNKPPTTVLDDLGDGTYYSATASVRRLNIDEYLPYSKGDVQTLNVQYGQADVEGKDYSYFKYWLEAKFYFAVEKLFKDFFEASLGGNSDRPVIFATRIIAGSSSGDVPYEQMYTVGGDTTLRGYDDDRYHGEEMILGNFELRVPMDKNFTLVAFYDIGRAWRKEGDTASFGSDMGSSPGFGVRINTPIGNLRLDYATGDEGRFHFGFGELF